MGSISPSEEHNKTLPALLGGGLFLVTLAILLGALQPTWWMPRQTQVAPENNTPTADAPQHPSPTQSPMPTHESATPAPSATLRATPTRTPAASHTPSEAPTSAESAPSPTPHVTLVRPTRVPRDPALLPSLTPQAEP